MVADVAGSNKPSIIANTTRPQSNQSRQSSGGGVSVGGSTVGRPKAPVIPSYETLTPEQRKIWDSFNYYTPDFKRLDAEQQNIYNLFEEARKNVQAQADTTRSQLDRQLEKIYANTQDARRENIRAFRGGRDSIQDQLFDALRQNEANLANRGLSDSGQADLAQVQTRMAVGDAVSVISEQFYEQEEQLQRNVEEANAVYQEATANLQNSVQSAITNLTMSEATTRKDYATLVDNMKRQLQADMNAVASARANYEASIYQMQMQLAQFQEQQFQADRQYNLSLAQMRQQAEQVRRQEELAREQMRQQANPDMLSKYATLEDAVREGVTGDRFRLVARELGLENHPYTQSLMEANGMAVPIVGSDDKDKRNQRENLFSLGNLFSNPNLASYGPSIGDFGSRR